MAAGRSWEYVYSEASPMRQGPYTPAPKAQTQATASSSSAAGGQLKRSRRRLRTSSTSVTDTETFPPLLKSLQIKLKARFVFGPDKFSPTFQQICSQCYKTFLEEI